MQLASFNDMHALVPVLLSVAPVAPAAAFGCLAVLRAHNDVLASNDAFFAALDVAMHLATTARTPGYIYI